MPTEELGSDLRIKGYITDLQVSVGDPESSPCLNSSTFRFTSSVLLIPTLLRYDKLSVDAKRSVQGIRGVEDGLKTLQKEYELAVFDLEKKVKTMMALRSYRLHHL